MPHTSLASHTPPKRRGSGHFTATDLCSTPRSWRDQSDLSLFYNVIVRANYYYKAEIEHAAQRSHSSLARAAKWRVLVDRASTKEGKEIVAKAAASLG